MGRFRWQSFFTFYCFFERALSSPLMYADQTGLTLGGDFIPEIFDEVAKTPMHYNLTFDDIPMTKKPKQHLNHITPLDFLRMDILNTTLAVEQGGLNENDTNCAVNGPNTIITDLDKFGNPSRFSLDPEIPSKYNVSEYFDFKSMTLKPMGPAPRYVSAEIHAWRIHPNGTALNVYTVFAGWGAKGFVNPIVGDFAKFFPGWGKDVNMLEVKAYTMERKPWPLCIGRLEFDLKSA